MKAETWTGLTDYAMKTGISISTLRRRIKSGLIKARLEDGKYFVLESPLPEIAMVEAAPTTQNPSNRLDEIKLAYMNVLQEKEDQILHLKEEVSDLKTLVRVLEDENARLRGHRSI